MNDELEQKRKEKVEGFKINFGNLDDFSDDSATVSDNVPADAPSELDSGNQNLFGEFDSYENIGTYPDSRSDITSYSDDLYDDTEEVLNKSELRAAKRYDKKRRRIKAKKNRIIFRTIWIIMVFFVSIMIGEYIMVGVNDMLAVGREEEKSVSITIPKNANIDQITEILSKNKVINNKNFFKLYAWVTKSTSGFTQGTFDIETNKDYQAIINYMQSDMNRTDIVTIQFREGITVNDFAQLLEDGKVCSAEAFIKKCNSTEFDEDYEFLKGITNSGQRYYRLEGYLFPDTYDFYVGEDPSSVMRKFLSNYLRKLYLTKYRFEKNEKKTLLEDRAKELGMSMEEVITMASLIQAEAADADDMYVISSIIHNRLDTAETDGKNKKGETGLDMLQLDSTEFYPYKSQSQVPASMRSTFTSTYSTYKIKGLPAGPICNPGIEAIKAALNPDKTDYYYFCHKAATSTEPAVAYYAKTNDQHIKNQEKAGLI